MTSVLVSLIAVAGTLLGSATTYLFQRRTAAHAEALARRERQRQDRLVACGDFGAAVTEVKRAVITSWFRRDVKDDDWRAAMTEADRMGAIAEGTQIRMLLLDDSVRRLADELSRTSTSSVQRTTRPNSTLMRSSSPIGDWPLSLPSAS